MRTSTILREVKRRLPKNTNGDGEYSSPFICDHVKEICKERGKQLTGNRIREMINKRINERFDVVSWLINDAGIEPDEINDVNVQEYRQRWLGSMIAEFAAKGD